MLAADEFGVRQRTRLSIVVWCPHEENDWKCFVLFGYTPGRKCGHIQGLPCGFGNLIAPPELSARRRRYLGLSFKTTALAGRFSATTHA
jgi:hypothetical protein